MEENEQLSTGRQGSRAMLAKEDDGHVRQCRRSLRNQSCAGESRADSRGAENIELVRYCCDTGVLEIAH